MLRDDESSAPREIQAMWDVTLKASEAAIEPRRPHSTGFAVDTAARVSSLPQRQLLLIR